MNTKPAFRHFLMIAVWLLSSLWASPVIAQSGTTILYVKPGLTAHPEKTCATWAEACDLQLALAKAATLTPPVEIWAAEGIYTPGTLREATFQLLKNVALYGGFAGTETARGQRNPMVHVTVLDGEIGAAGVDDNAYHVVTGSGTDVTAILDGFTISGGNATGDGSTLQSGGGMINVSGSPTLANLTFIANSRSGMYSEKSNPALTRVAFTANAGSGMYNVESNPTLTGVSFTVNGGGMFNVASSPILTNVSFNANTGIGMSNNVMSNPTLTNVAFTNNGGSGMYNMESNPTLTDVTFTANGDGGMYNYSSGPTLTNVTFTANTGVAMYNKLGGARLMGVTFTNNSNSSDGGGIYSHESQLTLTNVTFSNNSAGSGGGMYNTDFSSATLTNVTFIANSALGVGGGMFNGASHATLTNVTFINNTADTGGAMYEDSTGTTLTNVTFFGNHATIQGGGIYNKALFLPSVPPTLTNCILWGNTANGAPSQNEGEPVTATYSDIQGGYAGTGNIDADPLFVDAAHGNLRLLPGSPAIEVGSSAAVPPSVSTDLDGLPRFVDFDRDGVAQVDLGAYENQFMYRLFLPRLTR